MASYTAAASGRTRQSSGRCSACARGSTGSSQCTRAGEDDGLIAPSSSFPAQLLPRPAAPATPTVRAMNTPTADDSAWLVVIDPQRIFADPGSDWASPFFDDAMGQIARLAARFGPGRTLVTRWLPTADRSTAWGDYFAAWPFADVPADDPLYELVEPARHLSAHPTVDEPTFGKWGPQLADRVATPGVAPHLVLAGVSTDCCVVTTALAAADAGVRVTVARDACAASTAENGAAALQVMGLFPPQLDVVDTAAILAR